VPAGDPEEQFYRAVTEEQVEELVDRFLGPDDDGAIWAFVRLLHGLVAAARTPLGDLAVEGLARTAALRAYTKTIHAEDGFDGFAKLDPDDRVGMYPGVADVGTVG
jgi:hypothetical protein